MLKTYLAEKKELVEKNLQKILERYEKPELYSEAMKYAVMNGGKRLRPILMYMMCDLFGKKYEIIEDIACALGAMVATHIGPTPTIETEEIERFRHPV